MARTKIESPDEFQLNFADGDMGSFRFFANGDFLIVNPARNVNGRAMVVTDNRLTINYDNGFTDGVIINGLDLKQVFKDLQPAPTGVNTFDIVMDQAGNVYKKD